MLFSYYTIGQRIKELRVARNMSQALLSEKVDLSPTYISYIESGMKCMSLETLLKIANALDVTADTILADCFDNHASISKHEFIDIMDDCSKRNNTTCLNTCNKPMVNSIYPQLFTICHRSYKRNVRNQKSNCP